MDEQIQIVAKFAENASHLIANSYGGYLWLLSRIEAEASDTDVLLLSPVMGRAVNPEKMLASRPPRLKTLDDAISAGKLNLPKSVKVFTGEDDDVCDYQTAVKQCGQIGINDLHILAGQTHNLDHEIVNQILREFLPNFS